MKKSLLLLSIITLSISAWSQTISRAQLRDHYMQALARRSALDSFISVLEKNTTQSPPEECYLGICNALQIQYISGMWGKYKMLEKSRGHINKAIANAPNDTELKFIRFMLEHNIPAFLGMSIHMKDDLAFIFNHPDFLDADPDIKKMAMEFILHSKRCSNDQRAIVERNLTDMKKKMYAQK